MKKNILSFSLVLFFTINATDDASRNQQLVPYSHHRSVAQFLGVPRAIQLAHFRAQFVTQNPNATQQEIAQRMATIEQTLIASAQEFLAQQMAPRSASEPSPST